MFQDTGTPRARHWAGPLFVSVVALMSLNFIDTTWMFVICVAVAFVFGSWAFVNGVHHVGKIFFDLRNAAREIDYKFTDNFAKEILSQMTDYQIKAYRSGHLVIERYPTNRDCTIEKLGGTEVYLYLAWYMLVNSTPYNVMAISRFKSETYHFDVMGDHAVDDYQQARNFTLWLEQNGYAKWSLSNNSATWKKDITPDLVLSHLGMDRSTYKEEVEKDE